MEALEIAGYLRRIEARWVKALGHPFQEFLVLGMARILDRGEQFCVAMDPPAVLGWAGAPTRRAAGIRLAGDGCHDLLDPDLVLPVVAEVVEVGESVPPAEPEALERDAARIQRGLVEDVVVGMARRVPAPIDRELVEVGVRPAHRVLEHEVERVQGGAVEHADSPPDGRPGADEGDFQLESLRGARAGL
jgi:hypothetical protein